MSIETIVAEARHIMAQVSWIERLIELDRTDHAVKLRLMIDDNLFIQAYVHTQSGTTNFVLVSAGQRIFGRDCEGGHWHKHPFEDPTAHVFSSDGQKPVTLTEFIHEVEDILIQADLL